MASITVQQKPSHSAMDNNECKLYERTVVLENQLIRKETKPKRITFKMDDIRECKYVAISLEMLYARGKTNILISIQKNHIAISLKR